MSEYKLKADEPVFQTTIYNEDMEIVDRGRETGEGLMSIPCYYWIESNERDVILKLPNFVVAEEVMDGLTTGEYDSFEEAVADREAENLEIQDDRPPY